MERAQDKNLAYLTLLGERQRMKRQLSQKTKEEQINDQRERGFNVHFQGANITAQNKSTSKGDRPDPSTSSSKIRVVKSFVSGTNVKSALFSGPDITTAPAGTGLVFGWISVYQVTLFSDGPRRGWNAPPAAILGRQLQTQGYQSAGNVGAAGLL